MYITVIYIYYLHNATFTLHYNYVYIVYQYLHTVTYINTFYAGSHGFLVVSLKDKGQAKQHSLQISVYSPEMVCEELNGLFIFILSFIFGITNLFGFVFGFNYIQKGHSIWMGDEKYLGLYIKSLQQTFSSFSGRSVTYFPSPKPRAGP